MLTTIAVGVMIATLFARHSERIGRLYFADLVGAGIACAVVVSLIGWIGPPATIFLAGLVLALAQTGQGLADLLQVGLKLAWVRLGSRGPSPGQDGVRTQGRVGKLHHHSLAVADSHALSVALRTWRHPGEGVP